MWRNGPACRARPCLAVFTPGASVSERTAKKVRSAAEALGYRPNVLARSLITGRSRIIGLLVAYLENQFYPEAIERLSHELQKRGYHVLVFMAANSGEEADEVMEELLDYQVDGIIAASVGMSNDLTRRCEAAGIPIVLFNRAQDDDRLSACDVRQLSPAGANWPSFSSPEGTAALPILPAGKGPRRSVTARRDSSRV